MGEILAFLGPLLGKAFDLIPDPAKRLEQFQAIMTALQQWDAEQNEVNKTEAASSSLFVSGWRPLIGWCCALAVAYQYIIIPFLSWGLAVGHIATPPFPTLDNNLWQLTFGLLGMGGLRTLEKIKGVTR